MGLCLKGYMLHVTCCHIYLHGEKRLPKFQQNRRTQFRRVPVYLHLQGDQGQYDCGSTVLARVS